MHQLHLQSEHRGAGMSLPLPDDGRSRAASIAVRATAVALLVLVGLFHLLEAPGHFAVQPYLGILFWLTTAGSSVAAAAVAVGLRGGWILGAAIAACTFVGLIIALSVGLPGFAESLSERLALPSLVVEGVFLLLYGTVASKRRDAGGV